MSKREEKREKEEKIKEMLSRWFDLPGSLFPHYTESQKEETLRDMAQEVMRWRREGYSWQEIKEELLGWFNIDPALTLGIMNQSVTTESPS